MLTTQVANALCEEGYPKSAVAGSIKRATSNPARSLTALFTVLALVKKAQGISRVA